MAPALEKKQSLLLHELYYKKGLSVGRDKLYKYLVDNYEAYGISRRQVNNFIQSQEVAQLHAEHQAPTTIKSSIYTAPYLALAIDLVDLSNFEMDGYKFLFNGVDMFSRFLYSVPLKNKEDTTILNAFKQIIKVHKFKSVRSDNGSEFTNNLLKSYCEKNKIKQVFSSPYKPTSNGAIERQNGTLKRLIFKQMQITPDYNWVKNLQLLIKNLNNTIVRQFQKSPQQIEDAYKNNDTEFIENIHTKDRNTKSNTISKQTFKPFDEVRVYQPSDKIKTLKWSQEVYMVEKVFKPQEDYTAFTYKLKGLSKRYQEQDLQLIKSVENRIDAPELYEISSIVKPLIHNNQRYFEILWKGYKNKPTIEARAELIKDVPKIINLFEVKNKVKWFVNKNTKKLNVSWVDSKKI